MRSLTFIILIISKFKFVALIVALKSIILTFIFFLVFFFNCVGFFSMEALKFYKMKLGTGNDNNMREYRKLKDLSKLGKIGLFIYMWCLYLFFIRVNTYSFF